MGLPVAGLEILERIAIPIQNKAQTGGVGQALVVGMFSTILSDTISALIF